MLKYQKDLVTIMLKYIFFSFIFSSLSCATTTKPDILIHNATIYTVDSFFSVKEVFNNLLKQNGWIPLGTDFPVEDISPLKTFYAAVIRKDASGWPANGYQAENALSRENAIRGMTIWAARSNFEKNEKGSIEKGKFADFVMLDKDLIKASELELLSTQVLKTFVNGEKVYERK